MNGYYPGSNMPVKNYDAPPARYTPGDSDTDALEFLGKPHRFIIGGIEQDFYSTGQLASALERSPQTVRKWEARGIIPETEYILKGNFNDNRGKRRYYSRQQVIGVLNIAIEEGVLPYDPGFAFSKEFTLKIRALFEGREYVPDH